MKIKQIFKKIKAKNKSEKYAVIQIKAKEWENKNEKNNK